MSTRGLLTRLLSPLTLSGLQTDHSILRDDEDEDNDVYIETRTVYICPDCDEEYEYRSEAVDCCADGRGSNKKIGQGYGFHFPICDEWCTDAHLAANCCLWKDLTAASRFQIATAIEQGTDWADAIEAHGVKA